MPPIGPAEPPGSEADAPDGIRPEAPEVMLGIRSETLGVISGTLSEDTRLLGIEIVAVEKKSEISGGEAEDTGTGTVGIGVTEAGSARFSNRLRRLNPPHSSRLSPVQVKSQSDCSCRTGV